MNVEQPRPGAQHCVPPRNDVQQICVTGQSWLPHGMPGTQLPFWHTDPGGQHCVWPHAVVPGGH